MKGHPNFSSPNHLVQQPRREQTRSAVLGAWVSIAWKLALSPFVWLCRRRVRELTVEVSVFFCFLFGFKEIHLPYKTKQRAGCGGLGKTPHLRCG